MTNQTIDRDSLIGIILEDAARANRIIGNTVASQMKVLRRCEEMSDYKLEMMAAYCRFNSNLSDEDYKQMLTEELD